MWHVACPGLPLAFVAVVAYIVPPFFLDHVDEVWKGLDFAIEVASDQLWSRRKEGELLPNNGDEIVGSGCFSAPYTSAGPSVDVCNDQVDASEIHHYDD